MNFARVDLPKFVLANINIWPNSISPYIKLFVYIFYYFKKILLVKIILKKRYINGNRLIIITYIDMLI
jgi:hypothetical protein